LNLKLEGESLIRTKEHFEEGRKKMDFNKQNGRREKHPYFNLKT